MAYKRRFAAKKYMRANKKRKTTRRPVTMNRRRLTAIIKRTVLKSNEPKSKNKTIDKGELYHNVIYNVLLNAPSHMPSQGVKDTERVGDQINMSGIKLRVLFGQKTDRPNVTFRYWFLSVPKGSAYVYNQWFEAITNNVLLDDVNKDFVKVLQTGQMRPNEAGLGAVGGDEYTFTRKFWVPYRKTIKFGPSDTATTHNDDDVWFLLAAYDAYGTVITDNIAYFQAAATIFYKDP